MTETQSCCRCGALAHGIEFHVRFKLIFHLLLHVYIFLCLSLIIDDSFSHSFSLLLRSLNCHRVVKILNIIFSNACPVLFSHPCGFHLFNWLDISGCTLILLDWRLRCVLVSFSCQSILLCHLQNRSLFPH